MHGIGPYSIIWPSNHWKIPDKLKYKDIIDIAYLEILVTKFCYLSDNLRWNIIVADGLAVVETLFKEYLDMQCWGKKYSC